MKQPGLWAILKPYKLSVALLVAFIFGTNGLNLVLPKVIARGIDAYTSGTLDFGKLGMQFTLLSIGVLVLAYLQSVAQTYLSEKAARDMRNRLAAKISDLTYAKVEKETPSKLLTNLTSDIDAVKLFVSNAVALIISSIFLIIGASILLLVSNWRLALAVLAILPLMGIALFAVFRRLRPLFTKSQEVIDRLNKVINESIMGAALIRVLHSAGNEGQKFSVFNTEAKDLGMKTLKLFSFVISTVGIIANLASLVILALGGHFVISGQMTLGNFTAFYGYVFILIFPIIILGFVSNIVSRAQASYVRILEVLNVEIEPENGTTAKTLTGKMEVRNVTLMYGEKATLKDVSFKVKAGSKIAIIGPTAAGKTQLLYTLIGLIQPTKGEVLYDGTPISGFTRKNLHDQVGLVFQESVIFSMSLRENIAFSLLARDVDVAKAIEAAELGDFMKGLPKGLDTVVSERGTNLSGGQKQRIMLARALALNPKILLLDDFTARVDAATERKILKNIEKMYPDTTIISVTQKIASIEHFDEIILLMEGEILAHGTHKELMATSPDYMVILESQRSTNAYELRA